MFLSDFMRRTIKTILFIILLGLPFFIYIHYSPLYYIMVIIGLVLQFVIENQSLEERFYQRWKKTRHRGLWYNAFREGIKNFIIITVAVTLGQLFGNGYSPVYIINQLTIRQLFNILLLAIIISFGIGLVSWFENEKRFEQVCWRKENLKNEE